MPYVSSSYISRSYLPGVYSGAAPPAVVGGPYLAGTYVSLSYISGGYFGGPVTPAPPVEQAPGCWVLSYDMVLRRWFLSAYSGKLLYTATRFRCYGRNHFDQLVRNDTGLSVPDSVDLVPAYQPDCACGG